MLIEAQRRLSSTSRILALVTIVAVGCADGAPSVAPVQGKVTFNGQPLTTGRVMTMPAAGRGAGGEIKRDGTFELTTPDYGDGAIPGAHKVAVRAFDESGATDPEFASGKSLIPARYANPMTSGLMIEVTADGENAPTLELTSP